METITYYDTVDRTKWPSGPWDEEPDKKQWQDKETKLPCLAVRHPHGGFWCGYVGVPKGHPYFEKDYEEIDADVHGGLTFANVCAPGDDESIGICHKPTPGEPYHVWWLGFDCAHILDLSPGSIIPDLRAEEVYRDLAYVESECRSLARQILAAARPGMADAAFVKLRRE